MNDGVTISMFQLCEMFPDAEAAREFLEHHRWGGHVHCPTCGEDRVTARQGKRLGYYRCRDCEDEFTIRTGTIFERSHVPLHKWLHAIHLLVTARKVISPMRLSKELSVTQATAWFILGRLRVARGGDVGKLSGILETDETFGGGKSIAMTIEGTSRATLHRETAKHVEPGGELHTDEHAGHEGRPNYIRRHVKHGAGGYVGASDIHVNSVESMWAVLKRGVYGTWHHVSVTYRIAYNKLIGAGS